MTGYITTDGEFDEAFRKAYKTAKRQSEKAHNQTVGRLLALFVASTREDDDDDAPPRWSEVVQSLSADGGLAFVAWKIASGWNSQGSVAAGKRKVVRFLRPWPDLRKKVEATDWRYPKG